MTRFPYEIAKSLTDAQKHFLRSLPADGTWRETTERELARYGPNDLRGFGQTGLVEGYYREKMRHRLTPLGIRVCSYILEPTPPSTETKESGDA